MKLRRLPASGPLPFNLGLSPCSLALALALCLSPFAARAADTPKFELKDGDRVLFIGDTFFEREVEYGHIETRLTAAFPDRNITFRNLGWSADSPTGRSRASFDWNKSEDDWLKHVKEQVALVKPTVAFLSYGMTASLEAGEAGLPKFKADLGRLMDAIDEVSGQKVRFVLLGPVSHERSFGTPNEVGAHNGVLNQYLDALAGLAKARSAQVVNLFDLASRHGLFLTTDGVHLNETGYESAAGRITRELVGPEIGEAFPPDNPLAAEFATERRRLNAAIRAKNELFFHRWRPENWTYLFGFRKHEQGQNAVEIPKFDPLIAGWEGRIAKLRDLKHQDQATVAEVQRLIAPRNAESLTLKTPPQAVPTFDVADGFEVSLWAENPSLHKPIQMNWDPQGRLWIASSEVYPMIAPGQPATDSVIVLEDTDGDGKADKHTVFADGLLIPTGVLPDGRGGCYVAASHQLLHFADADGDGKADEKMVVLSSFGTEDTHHNLHTLRWGYDGHMYFNQSIYTHTHIETPHGVRRLNSAGIWRFNPDTWELEVFTKGGCNPWGHHWDQFGNSFFTDGAGFKGVYHAMEGATYFTYSDMRREAESISPGNYPKFASLELVHSPNFPADWQGNVITCDFRAHRVVRFGLTEVGSTWQTKEMPDLLRSTNVTFRPIDVRFGPDGALYVADWSNPIIQHGEVDFRDPRRDKEHGRIWRIAAKGGALAKRDNLRSFAAWAETKLHAGPPSPALLNIRDRRESEAAVIHDLLNLTLSPSGWEQEQSRVVLRQLGAERVLPAVKPWLAKQTDPRAKLEAMWLHEAFERPDDSLVGELAAAPDSRLRTAAARQLSR